MKAAVVIVGGHENGADVAVDPLVEHGPLLRATSGREPLEAAAHQALATTDLPVCVVPMTLGRDPRLVADTARICLGLTRGAGAGRIILAEPFGNATLLAGWLRVAVATAVKEHGGPDFAILLTASPGNRYDDAELFRVAHLVRTQEEAPLIEVAFRGGYPDVAEAVDRCKQLGAHQIAAIPADFGPGLDGPAPGVADCGPLLAPSSVSGMLATRIAGAMFRLSHGDDGIAAGLDADHGQGHGGDQWQDPDPDAG